MRIIADENMPYVNELFSAHAEVIQVSGRDITPEMLVDVDALLVRSVTKVNESLLAKANRLSFVGSATIGTDHVDQSLLKERGITFTNAPGCNANAVCDYVLSCLVLFAERNQLQISGLTAGIVGIGNIGRRLLPRLQALGMTVLCCDPLRAEQEPEFQSESLHTLLTQSDVITFHVPYTRQGKFATEHMIGTAELQLMKPRAILINACRGEVIDNLALKAFLMSKPELTVVLDVWENEPNPDEELLALVDIATPHIAGYSQEGKALGTSMVYDCWAEKNQLALSDINQLLPLPDLSAMSIAAEPSQELLKQLIQAVYDVRNDDARMRANAGNAGYFDHMRKNYPLRRELMSTQVNFAHPISSNAKDLLSGIGFQVTQ
ncbi:4-phosphoerythronate dehydrogenase [Echinimonas agarilytica]|uniref:Erythronate-4-phosphate dehydrogenase n=1 Tax=Echinimonas agarilytica TaxID=1215918 RepID=A0AA42B6Y4_9GAMM|nr:4-phosphoerythronate dehydrogenase [Echinimonas agarilytica]MCM2679240.1 4-phosphoerythronate dehydrogenase [Echinimonas agarilytica]